MHVVGLGKQSSPLGRMESVADFEVIVSQLPMLIDNGRMAWRCGLCNCDRSEAFKWKGASTNNAMFSECVMRQPRLVGETGGTGEDACKAYSSVYLRYFTLPHTSASSLHKVMAACSCISDAAASTYLIFANFVSALDLQDKKHMWIPDQYVKQRYTYCKH